MRCVGAAEVVEAAHAEDTVAGGEVVHAFADGNDFASGFASEHRGRGELCAQAGRAIAHLVVQRVCADCCGFN